MKHMRRIVFAALMPAVLGLACSLGAPQPVELPKEITVVVVVTPTAESAATEAPDPAATAAPTEEATQDANTEPAATATSGQVQANEGPSCSVLRNVNLRKGPGRVFDPPANVLRTGAEVTPVGFARQGFPDGSWIFVTVAGTGEQGWVSADPQLVNCSLDPSSLPAAAIPPTPVAPPTATAQPTQALVRLRSSVPDGTSNGITGNILLSPQSLLRFEAIGPGGSADGDHIQKVEFLIRDESGGVTLYQHTENNAPYCIFGGEGGCSSWPKAGGRYVWGPGGAYVENGTYQADIFVTAGEGADEVFGNWSFTITVELP